MPELQPYLQRGERVVLVGKPIAIARTPDVKKTLFGLLLVSGLFGFLIIIGPQISTVFDAGGLACLAILVVFFVLFYPALAKSADSLVLPDLVVVTDMRIFVVKDGEAEDMAPRTELERMRIEIRGRGPIRLSMDEFS